jgi:hypothetical protein
MFTRDLWLPALVVLVAVLLAACSGPTATPETVGDVSLFPEADAPTVAAADVATEAATPVAEVDPTDTATSSPEPIRSLDAITETLTYVDEQIGYAIDYPAGWSIEATPGSLVMLTSFSLEDTGRGGIGPDSTKIDIVPDLELGGQTLEALAVQSAQTGRVIAEEQVLLAGELPATLLRLDSPALGGETSVLVTVVNGRGLRVHGYGDLTLFDPIARSVRAAP